VGVLARARPADGPKHGCPDAYRNFEESYYFQDNEIYDN
jgi:hypothetical protein